MLTKPAGVFVQLVGAVLLLVSFGVFADSVAGGIFLGLLAILLVWIGGRPAIRKGG